jgi:hypothetical protein
VTLEGKSTLVTLDRDTGRRMAAVELPVLNPEIGRFRVFPTPRLEIASFALAPSSRSLAALMGVDNLLWSPTREAPYRFANLAEGNVFHHQIKLPPTGKPLVLGSGSGANPTDVDLLPIPYPNAPWWDRIPARCARSVLGFAACGRGAGKLVWFKPAETQRPGEFRSEVGVYGLEFGASLRLISGPQIENVPEFEIWKSRPVAATTEGDLFAVAREGSLLDLYDIDRCAFLQTLRLRAGDIAALDLIRSHPGGVLRLAVLATDGTLSVGTLAPVADACVGPARRRGLFARLRCR